MAKYETTVEQNIQDHELDHILGLGRGVFNVARLSEEIESQTNEDTALETTTGFIRELDGVGSGEGLIDTLGTPNPSTSNILDGLKKCSVGGGAVNALLDLGTDAQRQYLTGRLEKYTEFIREGIPVVEEYYEDGQYVDEITGYQPAEPKDIRTGLW